MTEKIKKNKSGAGKFFLGALLGGVAGAIAGRFMKVVADDKDNGCPCDENCDKCEEKAGESKQKVEDKKTTTKKTGEKK